MRLALFTFATLCGLLATTALNAQASVLTGTYDPATGVGSQTTGTGPYTLTSTDSTFSLLRFVLTNSPKPLFSELTSLFVRFTSPVENALATQNPLNAGGGGGAPRLAVVIDIDNDNLADGEIDIHLGTPPNYIDLPASLNAWSGYNLVDNSDPGRYDLSFAPTAGSNFTDYNAALAAWGNAKVLRATAVLDSFGGADKTLIISEIGGTYDSAQAAQGVPEPASALVWSNLALAVGGMVWRRRQPAAA